MLTKLVQQQLDALQRQLRALQKSLPARQQQQKLATVPIRDVPLFMEIHEAQGCRDPRAFEKWLQGQREDLKAFYAQVYQPILGAPRIDLHSLAQERRIEAKALIDHAVQSERLAAGDSNPLSIDATDSHNNARACALRLLETYRGDDVGLGEMLCRLPPEEAALFAWALRDGLRPVDGDLMSRARNQVLAALNSVGHMPATHTIVKALYLQISPYDRARARGLGGDMARFADNVAVAVTRELYPDDPARAKAETPRIAGLVKSKEGAEWMFGGSIKERTIVFGILRNPGIAAPQLFEGDYNRGQLAQYGGNPARLPDVADLIARALIADADGGRATADNLAEASTLDRIAGILQTAGGQEVLFSDKVALRASADALEVMRTHPEITFETFGGIPGNGENPWLTPSAFTDAMAAKYAARAHNKLTPDPVPGAFGLETWIIGPALGIVPTLPKGEEWQKFFKECPALVAKVAAGKKLTPHERKQLELIAAVQLYDKHKPKQAIVCEIADELRHLANTDPPRVDCEYVTVFCEYGPIVCPRFRVQTGTGADGHPTYGYVDNAGKRYANRRDWENYNQLPSGIVYAPNTVYAEDGAATSRLDRRKTPEAARSKAGKVLDAATMVGCLAAGVAGIVVGFGAVTFFVMTVGNAWMGVRSVMNIVDEHARGRSLASPKLYGDWLGLASPLLPFVGAAGVASADLVGAFRAEAGALGYALEKVQTATNLLALGYQGTTLVLNSENMNQDEIFLSALQFTVSGAQAIHGLVQPTFTLPERPPGFVTPRESGARGQIGETQPVGEPELEPDFPEPHPVYDPDPEPEPVESKAIEPFRMRVDVAERRLDALGRSDHDSPEARTLRGNLEHELDEARHAYELAREMANPYQTRPYNKYQLIDEIRTANHELEQNRRLRAAAPTAAEAAYYQLQAHEAAVRLNALRTQLRQMAHRVITEEDVLNADHAIVNAERQIAHAVRRIVDEQATPDGVSAGAISALEAARAAHQVASDAHSEMQTLPGYWRHQLESRRQYAPFTNDDQIARAALERAQHTWDTLASLYADEFDPD